MKNETQIRAIVEEAARILKDYPHLKYYQAIIKAKEVLKVKQEQKHDIGDVLTVETAEMLYKKRGIAIIVTDGRYVQIEKESTAGQAK